MEELISSGRIADIIIVLLGVEAVALLVVPRLFPAMAQSLPTLGSVWPTLLSGLLLVLALRLSLTGGSAAAIGVVLAAAGLSHVVDLYLRAKAFKHHNSL